MALTHWTVPAEHLNEPYCWLADVHAILITGNISATLLSENILLQLPRATAPLPPLAGHGASLKHLCPSSTSSFLVFISAGCLSGHSTMNRRLLSDLIICVLWSSSWPEAPQAVVNISQKLLNSQVKMRARAAQTQEVWEYLAGKSAPYIHIHTLCIILRWLYFSRLPTDCIWDGRYLFLVISFYFHDVISLVFSCLCNLFLKSAV